MVIYLFLDGFTVFFLASRVVLGRFWEGGFVICNRTVLQLTGFFLFFGGGVPSQRFCPLK